MTFRSVRPRALLAAAALLTAWTASALADTVVFKTGRRLSCKVIPPDPEDEVVRVVVGSDDSGSMALRMETIKQIEYDYASQAASLADDDYPAHYRLGLWCLERRLYPEAVAELLAAHGRAGVPPEVDYHLGEAFAALRRPDLAEALRRVEAYLAAAPEGDRAGEAARLARELRERMQKAGIDPDAKPVKKKGVEEGLEVEDWTPPISGWGNDARVSRPVGLAADGKTRSNRLVRIDFKGRNKQGKALSPDRAKTPVQMSINRDLTEAPVLTFHAYNPGEKPVRFAVAFTTGPGHEWFESKQLTAPPGEWLGRQRLDLTRKNWKCAPHWRHKAAVGNLARVRNMIFLIYNGNREGTIVFDAVRFRPPGD